MLTLLARPLHFGFRLLYGLYSLIAFLALGTLALLCTLLPLSVRIRRHIAHFIAQAFFVVTGIRVTQSGSEPLPSGPCVLVANHASYIDGVVLKAALPARFCFVIKKEVTRVPLVGLLLRRIGSEFVDRFNRHAGGVDARRLLKAANAGQALVFFPEGTFLPHPGVGKFHSGAFAIAVRTGLPIVPVAIRGTRHVLPGGRILPRRGRIEVVVLPALSPYPERESGSAVVALRDLSRARIVAALGEPDLSANDGVAALNPSRKS